MFKYELGQEVVFRYVQRVNIGTVPVRIVGIITGREYTSGMEQPLYRINRNDESFFKIPESDIYEYTPTLDYIEKKIEEPFVIQKNLKEILEKCTPPIEYQRNISGVRTKNEFKDYKKQNLLGLPHSVHFKEKRNRTTLVWKNYVYYHIHIEGKRQEYSTTVAEAHEEKFDRLYGFLMAYFKKVYENKSKTWRKKYLNENVYPLKKKEQIAYLTTIFAQNCGLETKEVYAYLDKITK